MGAVLLLSAVQLGMQQHPLVGVLEVVPVLLAGLLLGRAATFWVCALAIGAVSVTVRGGEMDAASGIFEGLTFVSVAVIGLWMGSRAEAAGFIQSATGAAPSVVGQPAEVAKAVPLPLDRPVIEVQSVQVVDEEAFMRRTVTLSQRQREVVRLAISGLTARQVGTRLFISERTVETHLANAYERLGVHSRAEMISELNEDIPSDRERVVMVGRRALGATEVSLRGVKTADHGHGPVDATMARLARYAPARSAEIDLAAQI